MDSVIQVLVPLTRGLIRTAWSGATPKRDQERNFWAYHGDSLGVLPSEVVEMPFPGRCEAPGPHSNNGSSRERGCDSH